ncbi:hypothetical protein OG331_25745 [Streptomyces sp. NBC_01017]|nr:hypothetical protein OG331_25745 [Streptomyces sp. NBC_01017]
MPRRPSPVDCTVDVDSRMPAIAECRLADGDWYLVGWGAPRFPA